MKRFALLLAAALLLQLAAGCRAEAPGPSAPPEPTAEASAPADSQPPEPAASLAPDYPIPLTDYPDPFAISACGELTDDQRTAYDAIAEALADLCENGWQPDKTYPLERRVSWFDYKLARNIIEANFTVLENLISVLLEEDSQGTQDHVDSIRWYGGDERSQQYYDEFREAWEAADGILAGLRYDGTRYGLAQVIAQWMADHVVYAYDADQRPEDRCNTAYAALVRQDAICDGYAKAFDFLCKRAGLETIYVYSMSMPHAWNMIRLDGEWYHIDTTWMSTDPGNAAGWFLMPDEVCYQTHTVPEYYWDQEANLHILPQAGGFHPRWVEEHGEVF